MVKRSVHNSVKQPLNSTTARYSGSMTRPARGCLRPRLYDLAPGSRSHKCDSPHVEHLVDYDAGRHVTSLFSDVVEKEFEVAHHHKLFDPALLNPTNAGHLSAKYYNEHRISDVGCSYDVKKTNKTPLESYLVLSVYSIKKMILQYFIWL